MNKVKNMVGKIIGSIWETASFILLLLLYFLSKTTMAISRISFIPGVVRTKFIGRVLNFYQGASSLLDKHKEGTIARLDLIELSIRNMRSKKTRTMVTVGGMAIGIATIVFLVSIGYGLQQLVITRVVRLDEMRQADVVPQTGGKVKITDETLNSFKDVGGVSMALPLIAVVGRVNYQNSVSDMAVYGVTSEYLQQSAIKPVSGKIFDSNELTMAVPKGEVAGAATEIATGVLGDKIRDMEFAINANAWIRVRENPSPKAKVLGYTKRSEGSYQGDEVWGGSYVSDDGVGEAGKTVDGVVLGKWVKTKVLLWKEEKCDTGKGDCEDGKHIVLRDNDGLQVQSEGYFAEVNLQISTNSSPNPQVLGITTGTASSSNGTLPKIEIASESAAAKTSQTKTVELGKDAKRQAVVNRAMLKVLGIKEEEAVGKTFTASFVVVGDLLTDVKDKIESAPTEYTIVGVTPDDKTPVFYVPFIDLRTLGVTNFSQVKVVVKEQTDLSKARRQIEAMGYITHSVADTVAQINSLFSTAKTVLAFLGLAALAVAALGMFNTLTVSLLERTREVGLMKAMGMKSSEVQELFLTESMIMGFCGGILGIIAGLAAGKLLGLILSVFAIARGAGMIDISYIPFTFVLAIIALSLFVGIGTGIFPARRATKISALNALRYE